MKFRFLALIAIACLHVPISLSAETKTVGVFVALADNKSQGIVPVPEAIGNGNDPERNLYWGTAEGLRGYFDRSKNWKLSEKDDAPGNKEILRSRTYHHVNAKMTVQAFAYKGSSIKSCIRDFESAIELGSYDLVVFIGHNGLMDFDVQMPRRSNKQAKTPDCIVLCCKSEHYFKNRLVNAGGRPILLTAQLMYPGSFILDAVAESWLGGSKPSEIRDLAGGAYSKNQRISRNAGLGVFSDIKD